MTQGDEPLDLGVVGIDDDPAPDEPPRGPGRWRWTIVPLATFAAGGVLGLVVADTRGEAAEYADVRLVGGAVQSVSGWSEPDAPGRIELDLFNIGEHEVEILGLEPAGMTLDPGVEPAEPVPAPPGAWVTAGQDGLVVDCEAPVGDGVLVRVRDAGGTERLVEPDLRPGSGGLQVAWLTACGPPHAMFPAPVSTVTATDAESVSTDVRLANTGTETMEVVELAALTPGLDITGPEVPFDVPAGESVTVPVTWTVANCSLALLWPEPRLLYAIAGEESSRGEYPVEGPVQAELVLLVDRVCGSGS
ncbi:hypothetical protein [Jiangella endophytica]|uniref:hypothetical protein n=1 Tax=Jiangella endophytica TaxID=1623398 RepID=UPI000E3509F9|nr:hypothetical protein [Jiangella endophytica]